MNVSMSNNLACRLDRFAHVLMSKMFSWLLAIRNLMRLSCQYFVHKFHANQLLHLIQKSLPFLTINLKIPFSDFFVRN